MFFKTLHFQLLLVLTISTLLSHSEENVENMHCMKDGEGCVESENFEVKSIQGSASRFKVLLKKIDDAKNSYEDCKSSNCSCFLSTLNSDLQVFKKGITKDMINSIKSKGTQYLIFKKKLYREKDCLFPARCSGIEHFLLQILPKLKDMELIINTRDWPQINKHFHSDGPVFSFSKTSDYNDILYPAWSFWEGGPAISLYPTGLGRWDIQRDSLTKESKKWTWEKKKSIGFFRGSRTSEERDPLVLLSRRFPKLVDAQYTKNQAWKSSADTLGAEPAKEVSLEYHCSYKYLFNFRGIAASFRFKHLFLCGSLVIHVGSEWIEFFYPALKPWVHYVPLPQTAKEEDILQLLSFLKAHDDVAKEIAERGKQFIVDHLSLKEVKCYWRSLLKRYVKLLKYTVEFDNSLTEIK